MATSHTPTSSRSASSNWSWGLTRPQKQGLVTLAVMLGTIVPTIVISAWSWQVNRPGHIRDVEVLLRRDLGLDVSLDSVRYPRPGRIELIGPTFRHAEQLTGAIEIARASKLTATTRGRTLILEADGLHVQGPSPRRVIDQIEQVLTHFGGDDDRFDQVQFSAPTCQVDLATAAHAQANPETLIAYDPALDLIDESLTNDITFAMPSGRPANPTPLTYAIYDLAGQFTTHVDGPQVALRFRLDDDARNGCEISLKRDRSEGDQPRTLLTFDATAIPMPCSWLNPFFEARLWLGEGAVVHGGTLTLARQDGQPDWSASFSGTIEGIDLNQVVSSWIPDHRLNGTGRLEITDAQWGSRPGQGYGWQYAQGHLSSGPGSIGHELLDALGQQMHVRLNAQAPWLVNQSSIGIDDPQFEQMGLSFTIHKDGQIDIGGGLPDHHLDPDAILTTLSGETIAQSPQGVANVRGLIRTFFPTGASDLLIPSTPESHLIQQYLPMTDDPRVGTLNAN